MFVFIIIIIVVFIFSLNLFSAPHKKEPQVINGVLDLSDWDFEQDGPVRLDGEWEFYWKQLLVYDDFRKESQVSSGYISVPSVWNNYIVNHEQLPGDGYATYRVKIKTNMHHSLAALNISTMSTAYKLMIDHKTIAENGIVGTSKETSLPEYKPLISIFNNTSAEFEIIAQVSNFTYARGGMWYSITLGTDQQIIKLKEDASRRELFILGAVLIMALYHTAIFSFQRKYPLALYFTLILLVGVIRIVCRGEYFILTIIPSLDIHYLIFLEYMSIYWGPTALAAFIHELYPEESSLAMRKILVASMLFLTSFSIISPIHIYTKFTLYYEIFLGIMVLYYLVVVLVAAIRHKAGARLLLGAILFFFGTFIYDCLYHWNIVHSKYDGMFPVTIFILILSQALILAQRFSTAFTEVEKLSSQLLSLNNLKDEFLANTSHELRTPLHGMINITESVLQSGSGQFSKEQVENLSLVVSSGKRLATLVNDILDYAKLKHGDIILNKKNVDIRNVIMIVVGITQYLVAVKPILLKIDLPLDLPMIQADEDRLIQIIYNIIGNAIKFTETGEIVISSVINNDMIEISVADTGIGIAEGKWENIFKSFEQVTTSLCRAQEGTGLGLSITKYLVETHGGKIWVSSVLGKGSIFTFSLPINLRSQTGSNSHIGKKNISQHEYTPQPLFETPALFEQDGECTILIIDDDYVNLQVLINVLSMEKHSVIAVTNGMDALNVLAHNKNIDLVILDIMLPNRSGYEVCKILRKEYSLSDLPVLMITAQNSPVGMLTGFEAGANDFLTKPVDVSELKARVKTLLQLKKSVSQAIHAEMAFLQAQIKPHFLYNALNTIISLCWTEPEKAGDLLLELSNYLRGSFNFNTMNNFISINKELEFVQSYISIEKARFEEKLRCQYEIDSSVDFMVPTLILQPIVENAVKHGLLPKVDGGTVKISIHPHSEYILIEVTDDGIGIDTAQLATLLSDDVAGKGVGLRNVNKRMKRMYGYGIQIISKVESGTTVSIRIPYERK